MKKSLLILSMTLLSLTAYSQKYATKFSQTYVTKCIGENRCTFEFKKDTIVTTSKARGRIATSYDFESGNEDLKYYYVIDTVNGFKSRYTVTDERIKIEIRDEFTDKTKSMQWLVKKQKTKRLK